ncbi:glutaredoxin-like protein NrdH [Agrococcus casei]|uniref:Glutaredoxin-like protein NrdH n=1 Tax=Agrococcus casei LMG 22410 TaxID=1255656 RepID=A0A1R4FZD0_9MICO|nr:glutaredoxin-like protein NrdH [Agrococcus casei]SJM61062.1 Glutaredoxin-like protein NrdH, required for reduction of Ribonucleotide reductase class Ib [Agrococcus casei LMG 22410]
MQVIIYTKPGCVQCSATTRYLDDRGVQYVAADVTADAAALEAVQQLGYAAAPVVVADGNHWSGFRPEKLDEIAGAA